MQQSGMILSSGRIRFAQGSVWVLRFYFAGHASDRFLASVQAGYGLHAESPDQYTYEGKLKCACKERKRKETHNFKECEALLCKVSVSLCTQTESQQLMQGHQ